MQRQSNILDPIHDSLDPRVFDDSASSEPKVKEVHRKWIIRSITKALDNAGYTHIEDWLGLVFTGSLTTYQYSDTSDVDVSLWVDVEKFPEWSRAEMIVTMIDHVDGTKMPGTPYPIQAFVVPSGVTREELYQPGLRSGYDLNAEKWISPPDPTRVHDVQKEMNAYYVYALETADKMERLLKYEPDKAIKFWHQIHKRRQRDQRAGKGDYSESNIAYKELANRGLFPQISDVSGEYIAKITGEQRLASIQVLEQEKGIRDPKRMLNDGRAFWYDEGNQRVYLSQPGGVHTDLLNEFNLPLGIGVQGDVTPKRISFPGFEKYILPEEKQAVLDAIKQVAPELHNTEVEQGWHL